MNYFVTYTFYAHGDTRFASRFVELDYPIENDEALQAAVTDLHAIGGEMDAANAWRSSEARAEAIVYFREIPKQVDA